MCGKIRKCLTPSEVSWTTETVSLISRADAKSLACAEDVGLGLTMGDGSLLLDMREMGKEVRGSKNICHLTSHVRTWAKKESLDRIRLGEL